MEHFAIRMLVILVLFFILNGIRLILATRPPSKKVERPSIIQRLGIGAHVVLGVVMGVAILLSLLTETKEPLILFSIFFVGNGLLYYFTRRKFKRYYEETEEWFYIKHQYIFPDHVYYENISDWIPLKKQLGLRDETQNEEYYLVVNLVFHDPEILLRKLTEMTFAGKFARTDKSHSEDPYREQEWTDFLEENGYGHIIEEFLNESPRLERD